MPPPSEIPRDPGARLPNALGDVLAARISRRAALRGLAGAAAAGILQRVAGARAGGRGEDAPRSSLTFDEIPRGCDGRMHVPPGYRAEVLCAWGDPLFPDAPAFDPRAQTADAQEGQIGANADWIAWLPLPRGARSSERGLLCVNHEFTSLHMMVPGMKGAEIQQRATRAQCELEMAAMGHSVLELRRERGAWRVVREGALNRRINARTTRVRLAGPAAASERLVTRGDPAARTLRTFNNCAGGVTPWGSVLICEENFNWHFAGETDDPRERENHARYRVGAELSYAWHRYFERFDAAKEPREPNRYGWVVEFDPYDPHSVPAKRTALGRFKHESASCALAPDGRVVVYSGDDDEHEHLFRFVSRKAWDAERREANRDLLDEGVLAAARFEADGTLAWLPLVFGAGPLTPANGFADAADVLIEARRAASLVGATRLDRPEDVEVHPDGRVFVMLTKNGARAEADAANPRAPNRHGHVLELVPPAGKDGRPDHAADAFAWDLFLLGGDPRAEDPAARGRCHPDTSAAGWLSCPDNAAVDPRGRLWIATDGAGSASGSADGVWACDTVGPARALTRHFFQGPLGCEVCGPCFTPDGRTLFLAVQHPGDSDERGRGKGFSFDAPSCRFPDERDGWPPRAAVVAITREDGGEIGV